MQYYAVFICIVHIFQEPGRPVRVEYVTSGEDKYDEGIVQTAKVKTSNYDPDQMFIYVTMWAVNKVNFKKNTVDSVSEIYYS